MDDPLTLLVTALALAVAIEGILYAAFPEAMKKMMIQVLAQPAGTLRAAGVTAAAVGVFVLWLVRG